MLWKCVFVWRIAPALAEELWKARVILVLATSRLRDGSAGPGNGLLVEVARTLHAKYNVPIVAQQEVAMAAPHVPFLAVARGGNRLGASSLSWNTAAITDYAIGVCGLGAGDRVIVVAPPPHLPRCCWIAERKRLTALAASMPEGQYFHKDSVLWYCRNGERLFRFREVLVRLFCLLRGDI